MEIDFTKEQFKSLYKYMFIINSMMERMSEAKVKNIDNKEVLNISNYIFSQIERFGLENIDKKTFYPLNELREEMSKITIEVPNYYFWEELLNILAVKTMVRKYGVDVVNKIGAEKYIEEENKVRKILFKEFIDNGADNLYVRGFENII